MKKSKTSIRFLILTAAIHALIFVTGGIILYQLQSEDDHLIKDTAETLFQEVPEILTVRSTSVQKALDIQGRVRAENRLELFPEVQGKLLSGSKPFREGVYFEKGEVIFQIDDMEARLQLYSSRSNFQTLAASLLPDIRLDYPDRMELYEKWYDSLHPEESLPAVPDFDHPALERFLTSRSIYDRYYQIKSAEDRLDKFTVRAPFSGVVSAARAEPGQSVGPQFHAGTFADPDRYLLTASVRQNDLNHIEIGDTAEFTDQQKSDRWTGRVVRINPSVDSRSQAVEIYLQVEGRNIREGMFLEGAMIAGDSLQIAEIPKTALLRNGYVYAVVDGVIRQVPVTVVDVGHQTVKVTGLGGEVSIIRNSGRAMAGQMVGEEH
jgi:membrane fusion protein, multidrug efflux system